MPLFNLETNFLNDLDLEFLNELETTVDTIGQDIIFVNNLNDLPTPVSNVITLAANKTYFFTNNIDLLGDRLEAAGVITIMGTSSETSSITSTGLGATTPLITSLYTLPIRSITIKDVGTGLYCDDNSGANAPVALDWYGVNFVNVDNVAEIATVDNFIYDTGAFINSQGLKFSGTVGTIGISNSIFTGTGSAGSIFELTSTAVITRRFRTIYSSVVAFSSTIGYTINASATIPTEGFILDTLNFSGGGTYISGILFSDNRSRWTECRGISNSSEISNYYMVGNATATTVSVISTPYKVAGTTTSNSITQKFTNTANRATYTGVLSRDFKVTAVMSVNSGNNNQIGLYIAKNGTVLNESEVYITANASGRAESGVCQVITNLVENDYIEIFVENASATTDITVSELSVIVEALN